MECIHNGFLLILLAEAAVIPVQLQFVISEFLVFGLSNPSKSSISQSVVLIAVALRTGAKQSSETRLIRV